MKVMAFLLVFYLFSYGGEMRAALANNRFGLALLKELADRDPGENLFISPLSITLVLSMTYNGARGETKTAFEKTLLWEGCTANQLNKEMKSLLKKRKGDKLELLIANSLWARRGISFREEFIGTVKKFYDGEVKTLDFSSPKAKDKINEWVKKKTKGKIEKIVSEIKNNTVLFLLNAIYFKGRWEKEFSVEETKKGPFHRIDGTEKEVFFMKQSGRFPYLREKSFSAVSLPYADGEVSMVLFLPEENSNPREVLTLLQKEENGFWRRFKETEGEVVLPRFRMEYEKSLNEVLRDLGLEIAFDLRADFSLISSEHIFIDEVRHKAIIEVNEEGTEAAAVTSVGMALSLPTERFNLVFNRPFLFLIRDNETEAILFSGLVYEP